MSRTPRPSPVRSSSPCPCGLTAAYGACCGRLHGGAASAVTAEQLMRSRYSAFVVGDVDYLLRTWAAGRRPPSLRLDPERVWTGLQILGRTGGSAFHTEGTVDFRARYVDAGEPGEQRENSRFVRADGGWVYDRPV